MSNKKTETLAQRKREVQLTRDAQKAKDAVDDFVFEGSLLDSFKQRVKSGEFKDEATARQVCKAEHFDVDPSQETKDALEAFLSLERDWATAHSIWSSTVKAVGDFEAEWAQARTHLQTRMGSQFKGNGFARTESICLNEDGSATISPEMIELLILATGWQNREKIGKVSGFVNTTESGVLTFELKVNNPAKAKG